MTAIVMIEEGRDSEIETVGLGVEEEEEEGEMTLILGIHSERSLSDLDQEEVGVVVSEGTEEEIGAGSAEDRVDLVIEEATEATEAAEVVEVVSGVIEEVVREGAILSRDESG
jgi:hypothetical protein